MITKIEKENFIGISLLLKLKQIIKTSGRNEVNFQLQNS